MKINILFRSLLLGTLMASCSSEVIIDDPYIEESAYTTEQDLRSYDLWYININATKGIGEVPFLQRAFTISFDNGIVYANNNIVGIGKTGNGFGIDVGTYNTFGGMVEIDHDLDGKWLLEVYTVNGNTIELHDAMSDTSYFLKGYQLNTFDYDFVFYDNIDYFLQEYAAWEKTYSSDVGALNDFDYENYLQFFPGYFRSSVDQPGTPIGKLQWDFEGDYQVYDVENDEMLKTLTLAYDSLGNDYFELYVINDNTIELYHPGSQSIYEFNGIGYQLYLKSGKEPRVNKREKTSNPVMKIQRSRKNK